MADSEQCESDDAFPCPACGFVMFSAPTGTYEICALCNWEDDPVQLAHPRMGGGANRESLVEAQAAALQRFPLGVQSVEGFERDPMWRPLREDEAVPRAEMPSSGEEYFNAAAEDSVAYYWKK